MPRSEEAFLEELADDIVHYLDEWKARTGLHITLHRMERTVPYCWHKFLPHNQHDTLFCLRVKESPEAWKHCVEVQDRLMKRLQNGRPLVGVCWAGQQEIVLPVSRASGEVVAFVSISGYRAPDTVALPRMTRAAALYPPISRIKLLEAHQGLCPALPDMACLERMFMPLKHMLTLLIECSDAQEKRLMVDNRDKVLYQEILRDIKRLYPEKLSIGFFARQYHCSYSCISHLFRKYGGEPFSTVLTRTRVDAARMHLRYTDASIREIASLVGYDDPNYFTATFRKVTGLSPTQWRKSHAKA